jgi:UDP-2,3-diacylglucosamine hydrolase
MKLVPLAESISTGVPPLRYFIADLHLDGSDSARSRQFREFLSKLAEAAKSGAVELYIVGDLFEFWYEYRAQIFKLYERDLASLEAAWKAGVKIFLFYGNRDFAYGKYVLKRFGATVLGDGEQLTLNDHRRAWLEHGDLLCTADRRYLRFRGIIRSAPVKALFWLMPWRLAQRMVMWIRSKTTADKQTKSAAVFGIDLEAARRRLEAKKCQLLICGHTHRHQAEDLGSGYRLIVLPPWCEKAAGYVDDGFTFKTFEL